MRKIIKYLILIVTLFIGCNVYADASYENPDNNYKVIIEDDADLLTDNEETLLLEDMKKLSNFGNVLFKSINDNSTSTSNYADNYYHNKFGKTSGSIFLIDMDNREIYIFSDGENHKLITNSKASIITDNVYKYASNKQYYNCAAKAFDQMNTVLNKGKIAEPMRHISNAVVALIGAFLINLFVVLKNSTTGKIKNKDVIDGANVDFKIDNVKGTKTGTHTVYNPPSSSSSGGGHSSGGGGGHSGGGGGHRF